MTAPAMKRIGILGGSSDQATALYYRQLNQAARDRLGGFNTAELLINSMNFAFVEASVREQSWEPLAAHLAERARALEHAGAELLICVSNTLHRLADIFTAGLRIPFLHIVDPTARAIQAVGLSRVALLGTKPVMSTDTPKRRYAEQFAITTIAPEPEEQDEIDRIIFDELCRGHFTEASKAVYLEIIDRMHARGTQGVILGCTEIPLLVGQSDRPQIPMFDTTALHVQAAIELALGGSP